MSTTMDLLDILATLDVDEHVHLITPSMGLWCGLDLLTVLRAGEGGQRRTASVGFDDATCPACLTARAAA